MKLYKVLIQTPEGVRSLYTDYTRYLPYLSATGEWLPGPWLPLIDNPRVYAEGYHLTTMPTRHGLPGDTVFEAEGCCEPACGGHVHDEYTFSTIRLLRKAEQ